MSEFGLYIDETGSGAPGVRDEFPYFGLGGILVELANTTTIRQSVRQFKKTWGIEESVALHGRQIRAMKGDFRWLNNLTLAEVIEFKKAITELIVTSPVVAHGCIVHKENYYARYYEKHKENLWHMRTSAAAILIERVVKYIKELGGSRLTVYFEVSGEVEDRIFKNTYKQLRKTGHPFSEIANKYSPLPNQDFSILDEFPIATDKDNELIQIADLVLFPIATAKKGTRNSTYEEIVAKSKIVDTLTSDLTAWVKYYCFYFIQKTETPSIEGDTKTFDLGSAAI